MQTKAPVRKGPRKHSDSVLILKWNLPQPQFLQTISLPAWKKYLRPLGGRDLCSTDGGVFIDEQREKPLQTVGALNPVGRSRRDAIFANRRKVYVYFRTTATFSFHGHGQLTVSGIELMPLAMTISSYSP